MKFSSFRLRIAMFAALLAGVAVTGFSGISYVVLYQSKAQNLDRELQSRLMRESSSPRRDISWESLQESRDLLFGENLSSDALLLVLDSNQDLLYQSAEWEPSLNPYALFPPQPALPDGFASPGSPPNRRSPRPDGDSRRKPPTPDEIRDLAELSPLVTRKIQGKKWRLGTVSSPFVQMAIAVDLDVIDQEMALTRNVFVLLVPGTLALVMLGAWWISSDALKSIRNLTKIIRQVTAKGLEKRVGTNGLDTEFIELVTVFNQMMERLERSFQQASRFSGDAAHELKTPLAILQGELEQAVQKAAIGSEEQQIFSHLLDQVRRLSGITRKLLLLSLADAGQMRLQQQEVNLSRIVDELAEDLDLIAPELELETHVEPGLKVKADSDLLTQVLQNLITNAVKYNLPNGWIRIKANIAQSQTKVTVSNASKGIPLGDRQRVFERFHRGDRSRNRKVEGFGLGLSLSREIARAHGGDLKLASSNQDGTTFVLSLPSS